MACTVPITSSPGRLLIHYQNTLNSTSHSIGWHFIYGVDLTGISFLQIEADRLATLLKACMNAGFFLDTWSIVLPNGTVYYTAPLTTPGAGTHAVNGNMQEWYSTTVAFIGLGDAPIPGGCKGRITSRLHCGGALNFPPGLRKFDANTDTPLKTFINAGLNASTYLPADFYGQQGNIGILCPVQWNAHTQRREGS